ncbi:hypothetical protein C8R43DRAFT_1128627 [Mycena crocata]|nr:hypothetical protein C8R43DRAFT_1128627 [Mycena crocata]
MAGPYTLVPVPVDRSLSILQIFKFQATTKPHQPLFRYESTSVGAGYKDIAWSRAVKMFDRTAQILRRQLGDTGMTDCAQCPVVGILANTVYVQNTLYFPSHPEIPMLRWRTLLPSQAGITLLISSDEHAQDRARKVNDQLQVQNINIEILYYFNQIDSHASRTPVSVSNFG